MNRHDRRTSQKQKRGVSSFKGHSAHAYFCRGEEHFHKGRFEAAAKFYQKALLIDSHHVQSLHQLGAIALSDNRCDVAAAMFRKVLSLDDSIPEAHCNLGIALHMQGRYLAAIESAIRAIALKPGYSEAYNNVGLALQQMDRHDEAIANFRKALALAPLAHARKSLAISLQAQGKYDEAIACLNAAIDGEPASAALHRDMGNLLLSMGRIAPARAALQKAIALNPAQAASYFLYTQAGRVKPDDPLIADMEQLAATSQQSSEQIELHFALGKALADVGQPQRSFSHYMIGNKLKRKQIDYDEVASLETFARIREVVTRGFLNRNRGVGALSDLPCFIVGMPRTGTTLVEQILASHPRVFAAGERRDFAVCLKNRLQDDETQYGFLNILADIPPEKVRQLGLDYISSVQPAAPTAGRITDKMPANFRFVGLIHAALPNARIIHVRRDAVDTCLACFTQLFKQHQAFSYDLAELGRYWRAYDRLMSHWREIIPPNVMLDVHYEDLVRDFEPQARRIVAHCGLEWDRACVDFHKTVRPVMTASWAQVRQPIYSSSVGRWRPDAAILQPLLDALSSEPQD